MNTLQRIRSTIRQQNYRISTHANEEMSEDDLEIKDLECIVLKGKINKRFTKDPRGTRFEIVGPTVDSRTGAVICRFLWSGKLLIITTYVKDE